MERLLVTAVAAAAIVASEMHSDESARTADGGSEALSGPARTTANHIRRIVTVLLASDDERSAGRGDAALEKGRRRRLLRGTPRHATDLTRQRAAAEGARARGRLVAGNLAGGMPTAGECSMPGIGWRGTESGRRCRLPLLRQHRLLPLGAPSGQHRLMMVRSSSSFWKYSDVVPVVWTTRGLG